MSDVGKSSALARKKKDEELKKKHRSSHPGRVKQFKKGKGKDDA